MEVYIREISGKCGLRSRESQHISHCTRETTLIDMRNNIYVPRQVLGGVFTSLPLFRDNQLSLNGEQCLNYECMGVLTGIRYD